MANQNFNEKTQQAWECLLDTVSMDLSKDGSNCLAVRVYEPNTTRVVAQFRTNTWDNEDMQDLSTMVAMYLGGEISEHYLAHYDDSLALYEGLDTDTIRKYVKDSYRVSKNFVDMIKTYPDLAICHKNDVKNMTTFKPEKSHAILYKDYYITTKVYEYIKDLAWV